MRLSEYMEKTRPMEGIESLGKERGHGVDYHVHVFISIADQFTSVFPPTCLSVVTYRI